MPENITKNEDVRRIAGAQECDCNAMVVGFIPTRGNKLLFLYMLISSGIQAKKPER